jgi:antitoxin component HigA of HigAB toxin-antitoxin module
MKDVIKVIRNEQDHTDALLYLIDLMRTDSDEYNETIELLAVLIEDYERKLYPPVRVDPTDMIAFRVDQMKVDL